jgi:hypothetical protein
MDDALFKAKLSKILEVEGYYTLAHLLGTVFFEPASPAICAKACDFDLAALPNP